MKKYFLLLTALTMVIAISCEEKVDIEKEKAAVRDVILGETDAWVKRDSSRMLGYYIKDDYQIRISTSRDTAYYIKGWKDLYSGFKMVSWADPVTTKYDKEFIEIKIMDESAWALYRETQSYEVDGVAAQSKSLMMMVLQKEDEKWLISAFFINDVTPPEPAPAPADEVKK